MNQLKRAIQQRQHSPLILALRSSTWALIIVFIIVWVLAAIIFYWRFPNNLAYPNFYAEDGSILGRNILQHGFLSAPMTTFNGYYIWGLYLIESVGFILNNLFYHGQLIDLP